MNEASEQEIIRQAMAVMGKRRTPKKAESSRRNIAGANPLKSLAEIKCTCEGGLSTQRRDHRGTCPKYRAIYYREKRGLPIE